MWQPNKKPKATLYYTSDRNAAREERDRQRGDKCMNLTNIHIKYMFPMNKKSSSKKEKLEHALYRKFET
jgi:hypothetical protein